MRGVFIASVGALLVLFLATSGYPAQGTATVQASGDITLNFGIQHEFDFEVRDNYDLDNGLTDGCARAAITGNDCSGPSPRRDGFVEQETRLIIQGSQGDIWKARIVLESEEMWEPERFNTLGVERAWADIKLYDTPVHVKVGKAWDELDPFRLVWSDDEDSIKVYATHGNISWAVWWVKEDEVSNNNGVASLGSLGTTGQSSGRDGDQDYYMARVTLDFGSFQVSPAVGYVRNRNSSPASFMATGLVSTDTFGSACHNFRSGGSNNPGCGTSNTDDLVSVDENVIYPGIIAKGNFGPVSFVGEVFGAYGEIGDDSAVDAQRNQDVAAYLVAADVGVKLGAWTPHAGIIFASGDDNPHDDDAEAYMPISADNENLLGTRGIFMDDFMLSLNVNDDSIFPVGNNPLFREYGFYPGIVALFVGLKGRPTKKISTDLNLVYLMWDTEKQLEYVPGVVSQTLCTPNQTLSQQGVCSNSLLTNGVSDGHGLVSSIDDEVGWELNGQVTYTYNKHVKLTISAAVFWPGDGAEVFAQCTNFGTSGDGSYCQSTAADLAATPAGRSPIEFVHDVGRADDEAFNIETELMVEF